MLQPNRSPRTFLLAGVLACLPLLGACGKRDDDTASASAPEMALGGIVKRATDEARAKLATENISLSRKDGRRNKAEITPAGDLMIAGKPVDIDERQRALLLQHRAHLVAVAEAGIEIGIQGADLGLKAAGMALSGVLSGNTSEIEQRIEAEAGKIKAEAHKLCDLLPPVLASQQALVTAIPDLAPYAHMDQQDIDDCGSDDDTHT